MVSALVFGSSDLSSSPGGGYCAVLLGHCATVTKCWMITTQVPC